MDCYFKNSFYLIKLLYEINYYKCVTICCKLRHVIGSIGIYTSYVSFHSSRPIPTAINANFFSMLKKYFPFESLPFISFLIMINEKKTFLVKKKKIKMNCF